MPSALPSHLPAAEIGRHYHPEPYATLVLEGSYEEAGDQGRFVVTAGDVLVHPPFSAHRDVVSHARTSVLDVPLPLDGRRWPALGQLADPDLLIRTAARDVREAQALVIEALVPVARASDHPADKLAGDLSADPSLPIGRWAEECGHSREWLSRRFSALYGVDSALYRAEARARRAWSRIVDSEDSLADIAAETGFADQGHMTRAITRLTGRPPGSWRRHFAVTSVQEPEELAR